MIAMKGKIIQFQLVSETEKFFTTLYVLTDKGVIYRKIWTGKDEQEPEWYEEDLLIGLTRFKEDTTK